MSTLTAAVRREIRELRKTLPLSEARRQVLSTADDYEWRMGLFGTYTPTESQVRALLRDVGAGLPETIPVGKDHLVLDPVITLTGPGRLIMARTILDTLSLILPKDIQIFGESSENTRVKSATGYWSGGVDVVENFDDLHQFPGVPLLSTIPEYKKLTIICSEKEQAGTVIYCENPVSSPSSGGRILSESPMRWAVPFAETGFDAARMSPAEELAESIRKADHERKIRAELMGDAADDFVYSTAADYRWRMAVFGDYRDVAVPDPQRLEDVRIPVADSGDGRMFASFSQRDILILGCTGYGKTVLLNSILDSLSVLTDVPLMDLRSERLRRFHQIKNSRGTPYDREELRDLLETGVPVVVGIDDAQALESWGFSGVSEICDLRQEFPNLHLVVISQSLPCDSLEGLADNSEVLVLGGNIHIWGDEGLGPRPADLYPLDPGDIMMLGEEITVGHGFFSPTEQNMADQIKAPLPEMFQVPEVSTR